MNYRLKLIYAINTYNEESIESYIRLRDVVCEISDNEGMSSNSTIRELLFIAAQKMRVFGYNKMNNISLNEMIDTKIDKEQYMGNLEKENLSFLFQNQLIDAYYTSATGALLDYKQKEVLEVYDSLNEKRIFLSAPTSFGKTYLLKEIIYKYQYNNILLIFPTIALLNENLEDIREFSERHNLDYKIINNSKMDINHDKNIFVLTPERVLNLLSEHSDLNIDFFFMDEIYKIDNFFDDSNEDDRDKVFRIVLYLLTKRTNAFYLAGPYINLDKLGGGFNKYINDNKVKLLYIDKELVKKNYYEAWKRKISPANMQIKFDSQNKLVKTYELTTLFKINNMGTSIVYCANQNQILDLADYYNSEVSEYIIESSTNRLKKFIKHLKNRYSFIDGEDTVEWLIPNLLEKGIGIHHGSIPKYIQNEILWNFNNNELDIIISTTSITEGVNTNSKNLIFYGSTKGGKPFKIFDIKNIIGRAGRYYHHFVGNVFFLDKNVHDQLKGSDRESLDFITFTDKALADVDIDNTFKDDLIGNNRTRKLQREEELKNTSIPESVFIKNRLIDKMSQAKLAEHLIGYQNKKLIDMVSRFSTIRKFLETNALKEIFQIMELVKIVETHELIRYPSIASSYSKYGFSGLLSYEIKKLKEQKLLKQDDLLDWKNYNRCYKKAFDNVRRIIEYKIPKFISIFASIFNYVCDKKNIIDKPLNFEPIINFYEFGVFTPVGQFLIEKGFPLEAIRTLESKQFRIMNLEIEIFKDRFKDNIQVISKFLDEYEIILLNEMISLL